MNMRTKIWLVLSLCTGLIYAQTQEKQGSIWDQTSGKSSQTDQKGKDDAGQRMSSIPMEGPVDPKQYIVGPSDMFALTFWGAPPLEYTLPVTPEGTLLIPTVGEVRVADMTLAAARSRVVEAVEKKYRPGSLTMTLIRPRSFIVTLRGVVSKPGQYIASAVDRVEKIVSQGASVNTPATTFTIPALTSAGLPVMQDDFRVPKINTRSEIDEQVSTRNIKLVRRNGDTLRVDIPKYYATLDNRYNPFLVDGDLIIVPSKALSMNFVSLHGAVNMAGRYEFVDGDSLLGLIRIAQGLHGNADRRTATIYRAESAGEHTQELAVDLEAVLADKSRDVPLQQGDRVLIPFRVEKRRDYYVSIGGEVVSPGIYPITRESTKLSDLIRSAGGITDRALLNSSIFWRKDDKITIPDASQLDYTNISELQYSKYLRAHQFGMVDSNYFFVDLKAGRQPVVINFKELLASRDSTYDVTLRHEDFIYIASDEHSVLVQGQVGEPGYVAFVPGADYRYYIRKAGDYQEYADEREVRIIKGGSFSWFEPGDTKIESGDRIWVPKLTKKNFTYYFNFVRDVTTVVISLATLIYIARSTK
jgi:polysaccharide export outer membrane protein